jgi:hypothetical protein
MIFIKNKENEAEFTLKSHKIFANSMKLSVKEIAFYDGNDPYAFEIITLIKDVYFKKYHAKISPKYPELLSLIGKNNEVLAALGIREAKNSELFLEQYLDQKIEDILTQIYKTKIERKDVVEIGSLASKKKGMAKLLYISLAAILKQRKYKFAVITATSYLQEYFKKAGLRPKVIAKADFNKLKNQEDDWGSYYESDPKVMILDVSSGYFILKLFLGISVLPTLTKFYPSLNNEHYN